MVTPALRYHMITWGGGGGESCVYVRYYTTSQPSRGLTQRLGGFGHVQKPAGLRSQRRYRAIIARHRLTSCDLTSWTNNHRYLESCPSHDVVHVAWSDQGLRDIIKNTDIRFTCYPYINVLIITY